MTTQKARQDDGMAPSADSAEHQFWSGIRLEDLTPDQWERLCDGCGRCCLLKLEDWDTGELYGTKLACKLLDLGRCSCTDYENRHAQVPDCIRFTPEQVRSLPWLPETCAYRLVDEGRPLAWWHHLVSGSRETVHTAGISVRNFARSELGVHEEDLEKYIVPLDGYK